MAPRSQWRALAFCVGFLALATGAPAQSPPGDSLQELRQRAAAAKLPDQPRLYLDAAAQDLASAVEAFHRDQPDLGRAAVEDLAADCEKAGAAAVASGRHLKPSDLKIRDFVRKLEALSRELSFDERMPIKSAIDRLEKVRRDLLAAMFGTGKRSGCIRPQSAGALQAREDSPPAAGCLRPAALAQFSRRDPLNNAEIDELRDAAQDPALRIPLYVKFIRKRATSLQELCSDPRYSEGRASRLHDLLDDIDELVQEMDDNIGIYDHQGADMRKALHEVIGMDSDLQKQLQAMARPDSAEGKSYDFALHNATESVDASLDNARQLSLKQEEAFKNKKKKK
jgi:hypothetical protein